MNIDMSGEGGSPTLATSRMSVYFTDTGITTIFIIITVIIIIIAIIVVIIMNLARATCSSVRALVVHYTVYIYIYIYICVCVYTHIYIYI